MRNTFLETVLGRRALLISGKGGVGKTLTAAAVGRLCAMKGKRVLIAEMSADSHVPSRIGEAFGRHITGEEPIEVSPGLKVALLTPTAGHRRFLEDVLPAKVLANAAMRSSGIKRFLSAAPAFGEMGVLYRLLDFARQKRGDGSHEFDTLVVDLPATGHALALAQVPGMILKVIPSGPIGNAVREGVLLLGDKQRTAAMVVTLLEPLPLSESLELVSGIEKYNVPFAGVIANRVARGDFSDEEHAAVASALAKEKPLLGGRLFRQFTRTRDMLARLSGSMPHPVVLLEELPERGPALVDAAAHALEGKVWASPDPKLLGASA